MSISLEYALENKNQPAVLCCRAEEGTVLSEHNLEDPAIFDDLVDSGLLDLTDAITIEQNRHWAASFSAPSIPLRR